MEYTILLLFKIIFPFKNIVCNRCKEKIVERKRFIYLLLIFLCVSHFLKYFIFKIYSLETLFSYINNIARYYKNYYQIAKGQIIEIYIV